MNSFSPLKPKWLSFAGVVLISGTFMVAGAIQQDITGVIAGFIGLIFGSAAWLHIWRHR